MKCLLRDKGPNKISCAVSHDAPKLDLEAAADKKKMEDSGSPSLIDHEETMNNSHPPATVVPVLVDSGKSLAFPTKYEDASTGVIANVTSVGDLREKVTLSWKNINVFVPQPRASICKRLCCGKTEDEPRIKRILFDGK